MANKYHVNSETGRANICRATKKGCPLGSDTPHFDTKAEANDYLEKREAEKNSVFTVVNKQDKQKAELEKINRAAREKAIANGEKFVQGHFNGERDIVDGRPGYWSTNIMIGSKPYFSYDDAGRQDHPSVLPNSFDDNDGWKNIIRLSEVSGEFTGLKDSQTAYLINQNNEDFELNPDSKFQYNFKNSLFRGAVSQYADEMVKRVLNGETTKLTYEMYDRNFEQVDAKEKLFYTMTNPDNGVLSHNEIYNTMIFPEKDLAPVLERLNVHNVSISPLNNGREQGLVYTVMTPNGNTRSFALFERRNYDSMGIIGKENWDANEQPYGPYPDDKDGNNTKYNLFAEMSVDTTPQRRAETLAYFLKGAQEGTLESDQELIEKAEHLDWNSILSKTIGPAWDEFVEKNGGQKSKTLDETMDELNEKDDFDKWEEQF